jgi:hypothetical protein
MHIAGPGRIVLETFAASAVHGRGGKGSIYVWASGNGAHVGDSCAYDGYASSPYTIAVGAIDDSGKRSYYSEGCPALMCVAPSSGRKTGKQFLRDKPRQRRGLSRRSALNTFYFAPVFISFTPR